MSWATKGVGGIFGSYAGAVITQSYNPKFAFAISGTLGLIESILGFYLNSECEQNYEGK